MIWLRKNHFSPFFPCQIGLGLPFISVQSMSAIEGEVRVKNTGDRRRRIGRRSLVDRKDEIRDILKMEFCDKIESFLLDNRCNVQILRTRDAVPPKPGIIVSFVVVTGPIISVTKLAAKLIEIKDGLGVDHGNSGLDFTDAVIEGK